MERFFFPTIYKHNKKKTINFECRRAKPFIRTPMKAYQEIIDKLVQFRNDRDWEQFHDSKNLALALFLEAAELNELFLWKKETESEDVNIDRLKEELADVLAYAFLLAEKHNLDVFEIVNAKIERNAQKYPVEKARGTAKKYNEL